MRKVIQSQKFRKNRKKALKRGLNMSKLKEVITLLANDTPLPAKNKDHALTGNWAGFRDCHIEPDWVLIYRKIGDDILELIRTGSHSDLF